MDDYFPVIDENIDPCRGCPDHTGPNGCASNGGCAKRTNANRIRAMSDEELADVFDHVQGDAFLVGVGQRKNSVYPGAGISWLDWLKQEADT